MSINKSYIYTYHLPFSVRHEICNILDSDESWRTLGGRFMALDATQLTRIGRAYLCNASPTEELLKKFDSANIRIDDLCIYLQQMNHERALGVLRSFIIAANQEHKQQQQQQNSNQSQRFETSLNTPTPSFSDIQPAALINTAEFDILINSENFDNNPDEWNNVSSTTNVARLAINNVPNGQVIMANASSQQPQQRCHKSGGSSSDHIHHNHQHHNQNGHDRLAGTQQANNPNESEQIMSYLCRNRTRQHKGVNDREVEDQLRLIMQISYNELKEASDNFSDSSILGSGGFASVYRGFWKGTHVAIKRLCRDHMNQALNELMVLSKHKIDNILPLYGISIDGPEACLVSQFMANGSLEDRLACKNASQPLSWDQRALIAEGVAKGLFYLHTVQPGKPLIHGDVKPANVLLDSQFVPKLADFGMARQMFKENGRGHTTSTKCFTHCTLSSVQGTSVYLPYEFLKNKKLSEAVDVYSYGVVMLEMATGRRAFDGKRLLIDLVEDEMKNIQAIGDSGQHLLCYNLKDQRLNDDDQLTSVGLRIWYELLLRLGVNCSHQQRKKRPSMGQVLKHFGQFREYLANSPSDTPIMNHLLDETISSAYLTTATTAATTRTLTPELSALDSPIRPLKNAALANNNAQRQQQYKMQSAALMSVEEEDLQQQGQQIDYNAHGVAVEDMIPLLTELGFESSQPSQQE